MVWRRIRFFVMALVSLNYSLLWALTGTIKDNNNNPLAGAEVLLVNTNLRDTTDATGGFSFSDVSVKNFGGAQRRFSRPIISDKGILFSLNKSGAVEYAIYSVTGAVVSHYKTTMNKGNNFLPIVKGKNALADGIYIIKFRADGQVTSLKYNSLNKNRFRGDCSSNELQTEPNTVALKKTTADAATVVDTLIITKVIGDITSTRKIRVYGYTDDINSPMYTSNGLQMVILDESNDNDGDGLTNFEERYIYHTNAELFDTDGDGMGDKSEILDKTDPLISNYPSITFVPKSYPIIVANFSKSIGVDKGVDISTGGDYSVSNGFSTQQQVNASASVAVMVGGEISKDGPKGTGSITATIGAGWGMTWGSDYSESMSRNWSNSQTYAQSQGVTINGGRIKIDVELINNSSVNVTLVNPMIRLISTDVGAGTISTEIGELTLFTGDGISGDNEVAIPFAPGQNRITRQFGVNTSNPDIIEHLARNSCGLKAQLTNIRFKTSLGEIDTLMANIYRRTAEVTIDFGQAKTSPDNLMKKSIASHAVYNDFYTNQTDRYIPMSLFDLLKATGANPVIGVDSGKTGITEINEIKNGTLKNGIWSTVCQITPDSLQIYSTKFASYDPAKIQAGQSSVISCIYDSDIDGDGVPTRVEAVLGTDDTKVDTDNDSLSDKEEFMGWRRVSDPAGVTWKTNPRLQDTDGDGLDDYVDPDPLSAAENPLDSVVSFSGLKLTPFQGAEWVDTTAISDSLTTFHVNKIMRGNTVVSLKFSHPVYKVMVIYHNGSNVVDTAKILTPDSTGNYSTKINLALGNNEVQVVAISKNGSSTKKVVLIGVDRRLVQIDNTNRNLFYVSAPSTDKLGIAANYFINIDSIKQLDPLIDHIIIARTSIYANVLNATDSANKKCADDLGDTGNGQPISAYSTLTGKDGHNNSYKIAGYLTTDSQSKVYSDDSLAHPYDYAYFPYTANTSNATNGKYYYSAPLTGKGNYFANERTIIIDTVIRFIGCNLLWGSSSPWDVTVSAFYGDYDVGTTTANINNSNNSIAKNIWTGSHEMGPSNDCDLAGQFKVAYLGWPTYDNRTWYTPFAQHINDPSNHFSYSDIINPSNRTSLCWIWYHIDFPQATTKDETPSITLNYSQVSYTDFTKKCWNFEMNDGVYKNHTGGVWVSWRYKFNDIQHD